MKKIRKLTSLLLVLVMSLALAVPCFAAGPAADDERNSVYLEMGDSYTDPESGMTFSFMPLDDSDIAEMNAAKSGIALAGMIGNRYYYARGVEIMGSSYNCTYTAEKIYGNYFEVRIDNEPLTNGYVRARLHCTYPGTTDIDVSCGRTGKLVVHTYDSQLGVSGDIGFSLVGHPELRTWYDVYQYWG
nr:hypothetical protein [uncultured Oscillibacter sp.]